MSCQGNATWFSCYPDPCGSDGCCCNGTDYQLPCNSNLPCGTGSCHTCNSGRWGFAWRYSGYCGLSANCGDYLCFSPVGSSVWYRARRVDTGPSSSAKVDFTRALFLEYAPLNDGVIPNMRIKSGC